MIAEPRVCLVTGASRGIGAAVARTLSADGHRVALLARDAGALQQQQRALTAPSMTVVADVTVPDQLEAAVAQVEDSWGAIEVLVCNAGGSFAKPLVDTSDADWASMLDVHLTAPFRLVRRVLPSMTEHGWGRIIVIASVVAKRGEAQVSAYTAAKHGVLGLVRAAAAEVAGSGVTVNAVCPGYVDTPMTDATVDGIVARRGGSPEEARQLLAKRQPIGRLVRPEEVATAVQFCVGNAAVTGQGINVDGGAVQS